VSIFDTRSFFCSPESYLILCTYRISLVRSGQVRVINNVAPMKKNPPSQTQTVKKTKCVRVLIRHQKRALTGLVFSLHSLTKNKQQITLSEGRGWLILSH
jgi:hypothetical protein